MSRLYYPPKIAGALASGENNGVDIGEATKKIAKLIPTELITAYAALVSASLVIRWPEARLPAVWGCFALCLILTPIYLANVADAGKPKRNQLIVGTFAFPIWAYLISGSQVIPNYYDAGIATIAALVFSLVTKFVPMNK